MPSSFWGMSGAGTDARNQIDQIAQLLKGMGIDLFDDSGQYKGAADSIQNLLLSRILNAPDFGTPDFISGLGDTVMPGAADAINNRRQRANEYAARTAGLPSASSVFDTQSGILDSYGTDIGSNRDFVDRLLQDTYGSVQRRNDAAQQDIVNSIGDSYGAAEQNQRNIIQDLLAGNDKIFSGLGSDIDTAYGDSRAVIDKLLNPDSGARAARAARAYAPALASTAGRLRKLGVSADSFEGSSALRDVELERSRAMDDAFADDASQYASAVSNLNRDKVASKIGVGTTKAGLDTQVKSRWSDTAGRLALGKGDEFRTALREGRDQGRANDLFRFAGLQENAADAMDRSTDYYSRRQRAADQFRGNSYQDLAAFAAANDTQNSADDYGMDLNLRRYQAGRGVRNDQLGRDDVNLDRIGRTGDDIFSRYLSTLQAGTGMIDRATSGYRDIYDREAQRGGWGTRLIGGILGSAAGAYAGRAGR